MSYLPGSYNQKPGPKRRFGRRVGVFPSLANLAAGAAGHMVQRAWGKQTTPMKTTQTNTIVKTAGGRYRKVHKDTVTDKHTKKAIQNVVKKELNKEIELKRTDPNWLNLNTGLSHRVNYASDLASELAKGDGPKEYSGSTVHLTSVNVKGWYVEQVGTLRGMPQQLEFYLVQRKGAFPGSTVAASFGQGMWSLIPEDQLVKAETAADNSIEGRDAIYAPQKRKYTVLSKKVIYPAINKKAPLVAGDPVGVRHFDFTLKIDKIVKPFGAMTGEEVTDLNRVFLVMRAISLPMYTYGAVVPYTGEFQTKLFFRDA